MNKRTLTITRKFHIQGCAARYNILVNGKNIGRLGNGQTVSVPLPEGRCTVQVVPAIMANITLASAPVQIFPRERDVHLVFQFRENRAQLTGADGQRDSYGDALRQIAGEAAMTVQRSMTPNTGAELWIGEYSLSFFPDEGGCILNSYADITDNGNDEGIIQLSPAEQVRLMDAVELALYGLKGVSIKRKGKNKFILSM